MQRSPSAPTLPVRRDLNLLYLLSLVVALGLIAASVLGLVFPERIYPTEELRRSFLANEVVNLAIGVPILLGSMCFARRGRLLGLLFWPGALFYTSYNYIAYVFCMPVNLMFVLYLTLLPLSVYTMVGLVASIDGKAVQQRLAGVVPERFAGGALVGLGILVILLIAGLVAGALAKQTEVPETELAVRIADAMIAPAWIVGGILLWRHKALGYVSGVGLLFQGSMLFVGLIAIILLQPFLTGVPVAWVDVIVLVLMGSVCFVPFGLFVRGVVMRIGNQEATP